MKKLVIACICVAILIVAFAAYRISEADNKNAEEQSQNDTNQHDTTVETESTTETENTLPFIEIPEDDENEVVATEEDTTDDVTDTELPDDNNGLGENDTDWVEIID